MGAKKETNLVHKNSWIFVAAEEFNMLREHFGMGSCAQVARELGCSKDTVGKLNRKHPDPSLRFTTLLRLYNTLLYVYGVKSPIHMVKKEHDFILESLGRILSQSFEIPLKAKQNLIDEGYLNEDGTRKDLFR